MHVQCPVCGAAETEDTLRCTNCGTDLLSEPVALSGDGRPPTDRRRGTRGGSRLHRGAIALGALALVVVVSVALWVTGRTVPSREVQARWRPVAARITPLHGPRNEFIVSFYGRAVRFASFDDGTQKDLVLPTAPRKVWDPTDVIDVVMRDDALVAVTQQATYFVSQLGKAHPRVVVFGDFFDLVTSSRGDRIWIDRPTGGIREVRTDGRVVARARVPTGWTLARAPGLDQDRLLLTRDPDGKLAVWDPHAHHLGPVFGSPRTTVLLGAGRHFVIWRDGDCGSACRAVLTDVRTGNERLLAEPTGVAFEGAPRATISPNGRFVALDSLTFASRATPVAHMTVVSTETGSVRWVYDSTSPFIGTALWGSTSDWLLISDGPASFAHRNRKDARAIPIGGDWKGLSLADIGRE